MKTALYGLAALVLLLVLLPLLRGRGGAGTERSREARAWVESGAKLVDVRTPGEFRGGHIPGALNVPVDELPARLAELGGPDERIVLYCRSGNRSGRAERLLRERGFQQVLDLGPMTAW